MHNENKNQEIEEVNAVARRLSSYEIATLAAADWLLKNNIIKTFYIPGQDYVLGIYCYEDGRYKNCEHELRKKIVESTIYFGYHAAMWPSSFADSVLEAIKLKTMTEFNPAHGCISFLNGLFCFDRFVEDGDIKKAMVESSPELVIIHKIPWRLNIDIFERRPELMKYIPPKSVNELITLFRELAPKSFNIFYTWVRKPKEPETVALKRVTLLLEWIGYTLYPYDYPLNKALLLYNDLGAVSEYIRLLRMILADNYVGPLIRPYSFVDSGYYMALMLTSSFPYSKRGIDLTTLKRLVGEEPIVYKSKFKGRFIAKSYTKTIFEAYRLPDIQSQEVWSRVIPVEFVYTNYSSPDLIDNVIKDEIEAIILLSLYAFRLVLKRKAFSDPQTSQDNNSDIVYSIVRRMLDDGVVELRQDRYVIKSDLYALYRRYVELMNNEGNDIKTLAQKDFTIRLTRLFPVRVGTARVCGKQRHVYWGITIRDYDKARQLVDQVETPQHKCVK